MADSPSPDPARLARRQRRAEKLAAVGRSAAYLMPAGRRLLPWSLLTASVLLVLLVGLYVSGYRQTFSPGPLAVHHASLDARCEQCHVTGRNVVDLRCERCHDAGLTDRLLFAAHGTTGEGEVVRADLGADVTCATCHRDHLGRDFAMSAVADGDCVTCHRDVPSLGRHPEFAVVRAGRAATAGMIFGHQDHLETYLPTVSSAGCQYCHVPTADNRSFEPMTFEASCSGSVCHTAEDGTLEDATVRFRTDLVVPPDQLPAYWRRQTVVTGLTPDLRAGYSQGVRVAHRDGWLIANALRITEALDPVGTRAELASLERDVLGDRVAQQVRALGPIDDAALAETIAAVDAEIAALDAAIESPPGAGENQAALQSILAAVGALAGALGDADPDGRLAAALNAATAAAPAPARTAMDVEATRTRLVALLDAIDTRLAGSGQSDLLAASAALREQALAAALAPDAAEDPEALRRRLSDLETVIRAAGAAAGAGGAPAAKEIDALRREASAQLDGGLTPAAASRLRIQLFSALDAVDARAGAALRSETAALRRRIATLAWQTAADDLRDVRASRERLLARLRTEQTLRSAGDAPPAAPSPSRPESPAVARHRQDDQTRLAHLQQRLPPPATSSDGELQSARRALAAPCIKCHTTEYDGVRFDRVRIDEPAMGFAVFNHAPHVTLPGGCDNCHGSATTSTLASDVNLPPISKCQECHTPSEVRSTCVTCHVYHRAGTGGGH